MKHCFLVSFVDILLFSLLFSLPLRKVANYIFFRAQAKMSNFSQQWLVNFRRNGIIHPEQLMEIVLASLNSQRYDFEMNDRSTAKLLMQRAPVQKRSTALPPCVLLLWATGYVIVVAGCHVGGEKRREGEGHLADHPEPARCHLLSSASPLCRPFPCHRRRKLTVQLAAASG